MQKRIIEGVEVRRSAGNVFADLELADAEKLKIKTGLVVEIRKAMRALGLNQQAAAKRMGIPQPKVSGMMHGDFTNLSERKLMDCLNREQAERERIERMSAAELAAEIERQRPPRALDLVERDQAVLKADGERQALQNQHTEAARARDQAQAWREAHKVQAWLHDKGIGHAPELRELEEQRAAHHTEWQRLGPRVLDAEQRASSARDMARLRIQSEQSPALAKVAELEKLR